MYAERKPPATPPCESCRVELMVENEEVAAVYMMCRGQVITAAEGRVIDISIPAIKAVMDLFQVEDQKDCMTRVVNVFHHFRGKANAG